MSQPVVLDHVEMRFGNSYAVRDVSLEVGAGEFFSILGPSGCGKTTVLRIIAGFLQPTGGKVLIGERDVVGLPPNRRPTAMVFQSLALFPLMSVADNIAFGLEMRGMAKRERLARAEKRLELIALPGFGGRMVNELSGGQRQRVAIARALAVEPDVLLLDEPLSALDLKLRQHMRAELRAIQRQTGVTFIYITHDQSEAMAMSDRVAVMEKGHLHQVGRPREIYERPATSFVARFVGETNAFTGKAISASAANGEVAIDSKLGRFSGFSSEAVQAGDELTLFVRPEHLQPVKPNGAVANQLSAQVARVDFEGAYSQVLSKAGDGSELTFTLNRVSENELPREGEAVMLAFEAARAVVTRHG